MPDIDDGYGNANTTNTIEKVADQRRYRTYTAPVAQPVVADQQRYRTYTAPMANPNTAADNIERADHNAMINDVARVTSLSNEDASPHVEQSLWDAFVATDKSPYTPTQAELMENPDLMTEAMWEQQRNQGYDPSNTGVNVGGDGGGNNGAAAAVAEVVPRVHGTLDDYGNGTNNSTSNNKYADNYFKAIPDSAFLPVTGTVNTGAITSPKLTGVPISYGNSRNGGRKWNSGVFGQKSGGSLDAGEG